MGELENHESIKALRENESVDELAEKLRGLIEARRTEVEDRQRALSDGLETYPRLLKILEDLAVKDAELDELEKQALKLLILRLEKL